MNRSLAGVAVATLLLTGIATVATAPVSARPSSSAPKAVNGAKISRSLRAAVAALPVSPEVRSGYVRSKFKLWDDVDSDCRNTRAEVLATESRAKTSGRCTIRSGRWTSYYDGLTFSRASRLDIDHLVPLAEAWDSGARLWSAARREAYANDLTERATLVAVSASANRSKGDGDPADWLPARARCRYVAEWTVVKTRWGLTVDPVEKARLTAIAHACPNRTVTTHRARVLLTGTPAPTPSPGTSGTSSPGLDPRFSTCTEAKAHGYGPYYAGTDPEYAWYEDRDNDGVVCE